MSVSLVATAAARIAPLGPVHTHPWHHTAHHLPPGGAARFRNPWDALPPTEVGQVLPWLLTRRFRRTKGRPAPRVALAAAAVQEPPARLRLAWLGHSTVLVQWAGLHILTDPIFSDRCSPFSFLGPKREVALPLDPPALPRIDVVLLSHDHYDHFDAASIRFLHQRDDPFFVVPLGVDAHLPPGSRVGVLDWHQALDLSAPTGRVRLHAAPAKHFSGRGLPRNPTLWASYYLEALDAADAPRLYYAGDSAYAPHFAEVAARYGPPEVALMPIGAYLPRWLMAPVHVTPEEAVQALHDLGAPHVLPIHWGTFDLADESLHTPPEAFAEAAHQTGYPEDRLHVLPVGGVWTW